METATQILEFLQTSGGWGLSVAEGYVIAKLYRDMKDKDAKIFDLLNSQNEILDLLRGKQ